MSINQNVTSQNTAKGCGCLLLIFFMIIFMAGCMASFSGNNNDTDTDDSYSSGVATSNPLPEADAVPETEFVNPPVANDYSDLSDWDAEILEDVGTTNSRMRPLTLEEGKAILEQLAIIHPQLYDPERLTDVRSTCGDLILTPQDEETLIERTIYRFVDGTGRFISIEQAKAIIAVVKDSGSCELNPNYTGVLEMPAG